MIKIDTCMIVKNEADKIKSLIDQLVQFSHKVYITDTGSTDGTIELIEEYSKKDPKVVLSHFEWIFDFAAARNYSFQQSTDGDYLFWIDADDIINEPLMESLKKLAGLDAELLDKLPTIICMKYKYFQDNDHKFNLNRLVKRSYNPTWYGEIHETLSIVNEIPVTDFFPDDAYIIHNHPNDKNTSTRNLEIFRKIEQNGKLLGCRKMFYYGCELCNHKYFVLAYLVFAECAKYRENDNTIYWVDQVNSLNRMKFIKSYCKFAFTDDILDVALRLYDSGIRRGDLECLIGDEYYERGDYKTAIGYYKEAYEMGPPPSYDNFLYMDHYHGLYPMIQLTCCYYHMDDMPNALMYHEICKQFAPTNSSVINNEDFFSKYKKEHKYL